MIDMTATIVPKSDQLNSDDLITGPRTITVTRVSASPDSPEQPVSIFFQGDNGKPYKPCKSMRRVMVAAWGADAAQYVGRSMTLYRDPAVAFGGMQVGGIRISHMTHIDSDLTMALTVTKARRAGYTVKKMQAPKPPADDGLPPLDAATALRMAEAAARKGTDHFRAWFNTDAGKDCRATGVLTPDAMARIKGICEATDKAMDADPFGLPPVTPEALAAAEAEARGAIEAQDRAAQVGV